MKKFPTNYSDSLSQYSMNSYYNQDPSGVSFSPNYPNNRMYNQVNQNRMGNINYNQSKNYGQQQQYSQKYEFLKKAIVIKIIR